MSLSSQCDLGIEAINFDGKLLARLLWASWLEGRSVILDRWRAARDCSTLPLVEVIAKSGLESIFCRAVLGMLSGVTRIQR